MVRYHVMKNADGDWIVKKEGNKRPSSKHNKKTQATKKARGFAKSGDHIVDHKRNNAIRKVTEVQ